MRPLARLRSLFPQQYTDRLAGLTDLVDPMEPSLVRAVVAQELLHDGEAFDDVFASFDDEPLGAASVAQVHRATLTDAYGGQTVAVKVQRPAIEAKLLGDVAALKALAGAVRGVEAIPVDYYTVFCELEAQLADEFDFVNEAAAMERIGAHLSTDADGTPCTPVIVTPRPVGGLVTRRVLVMDYLPGVPLSRAVDEMRRRGIDPDSAEAQLFGRKLLSALTEAFGRTILELGFFHADPHPGNIFVLDDGRIGLIDFGQVKQIGARQSATLARVMIALAQRTSDEDPKQLDEISRLALELGVRLRDDAPREGPAATAIWLFDGSVTSLPGGFDVSEISPNSPVKVLKTFPQELTLVGRSTVLIKGIAARLGVTWSLANEWAPIASRLLARQTSAQPRVLGGAPRLGAVFRLLASWLASKTSAFVLQLPAPLRRVVAAAALRVRKLKEGRSTQIPGEASGAASSM
jgi:aarF domain-containing kinase